MRWLGSCGEGLGAFLVLEYMIEFRFGNQRWHFEGWGTAVWAWMG
jgi:hypothetical protein